MTKTHTFSDSDSFTEIKPTNIFIGQCSRCLLPSRVEIDDEKRDYTFMTCLHCDDDVPSVEAKRLYASTTTGECDTRCMFAVGRICNCACGGVNHAGDWRFNKHTNEITADAVKKLIERRKRTVQRREKREQSKREEAARPFNEWVESLDDEIREIIEWVSDYDNVAEQSFLVDMRLRMMPSPNNPVKYPARPLTDAQLRGVVNMYAAHQRRLARDAEWDAIKKPVPVGRHEIVGEIVSGRIDEEEESGYGYYSRSYTVNVYYILILCEGFKLWGKCPEDLIETVFPFEENLNDGRKFAKGSKIKMRATLKRSQNDESFGFFSRPFKPELTDDAVSVSESAPKGKTAKRTESAPEKLSAPSVDKPKRSAHADCTHEATKAARAKCRRERASK